MIVFYKIWKKYNEIQLRKNWMDLNNLKMKTLTPAPVAMTELQLGPTFPKGWYFL